jgi:hypothetical protein
MPCGSAASGTCTPERWTPGDHGGPHGVACDVASVPPAGGDRAVRSRWHEPLLPRDDKVTFGSGDMPAFPALGATDVDAIAAFVLGTYCPGG